MEDSWENSSTTAATQLLRSAFSVFFIERSALGVGRLLLLRNPSTPKAFASRPLPSRHWWSSSQLCIRSSPAHFTATLRGFTVHVAHSRSLPFQLFSFSAFQLFSLAPQHLNPLNPST